MGTMAGTVQSMVQELQDDDPDFRYEMNVLREQSGFETGARSPLVRRWRNISGHDPIGVPFGSEAPLMSSLTEDTIVVGPGDMRTAHSQRECVPLAELDLCVSWLTELLMHPLESAQ